jgi:hypothetical protein
VFVNILNNPKNYSRLEKLVAVSEIFGTILDSLELLKFWTHNIMGKDKQVNT